MTDFYQIILVLIGYLAGNAVWGPLNAAILEDTNWYRIKEGSAFDWRFGKNEGCGFLEGPCMNVQPVSSGDTLFPQYFCSQDQFGTNNFYKNTILYR